MDRTIKIEIDGDNLKRDVTKAVSRYPKKRRYDAAKAWLNENTRHYIKRVNK